ncbi:MAG TPA: serine hydroxymethyltransferase [Solirubrobacteraceae bacterium]|nr:serine hydroxymethyltransferase [Solirubrobacteraceae bacterium]
MPDLSNPPAPLAPAALAPRDIADPELSPAYFEAPLAEVDPEVADALRGELHRQRGTLEMIASENFVPRAILECQGSVLTNKYAEGYPGRRYYGGCEWVDVSEQLAIDRAKALFGAEHANVQPHSGAQANTAVYHALLQPGDTIMGLSLAHGGHLTHGMKINVSGRLYDIAAYEVDRDSGLIDMDALAEIARERRPKLLLAGWSAYPRELDFARFRAIADEVGALLMVDMAHFAGLVAAGLHPNPLHYGADVATTTTHKTLGGPRAGIILCRSEHAKKIDSAIFPGQQGGPLEHVIAAKAVALRIAKSELFRERQRRTVAAAKILAERLLAAAGQGGEAGSLKVLTGGTDVHLVLVDLRELRPELSGRQAEDRLHEIAITVNRNAIPFDPRPPMEASGLRIGTPALATRGLTEADFADVGEILAAALLAPDFPALAPSLAERVQAIVAAHPLYEGLSGPGLLPAS